MARLARLVVPGYPHHVTQRGVRSIDIFSDDDDRQSYLQFIREESDRFGVSFLGWCLMSNHVHLIAVPEREDSLARAIGEAHRRYTRMWNFRAGVRGYLFQGRFSSCVLDQQHLLAAGRYVERNPVAAAVFDKPQDYPWSSCRYHCRLMERDPLVQARILPEMVGDWPAFIAKFDDETAGKIRRQTRSGRPLGDERFLLQVEVMMKRVLRPGSAGRPRKYK